MTPEEQIAIAKMPQQTYEKCQLAYDLVLAHFNGDGVQAVIWFETPNEFFDSTPPKQLMINGNIDKLLKFLEVNAKRTEH